MIYFDFVLPYKAWVLSELHGLKSDYRGLSNRKLRGKSSKNQQITTKHPTKFLLDEKPFALCHRESDDGNLCLGQQ